MFTDTPAFESCPNVLPLAGMTHRLILTLALFAAVPAVAADETLPAADPPGLWRYITHEEDNTTSRCIGRPQTPLCAAETLLACFLRGRAELCRLVDDDSEQYRDAFVTPANPDSYLAYRVLAARRKANAVVITVDQREGTLGQPAPPTGTPAATIVLKRKNDGSWTVIDWGDPAE